MQTVKYMQDGGKYKKKRLKNDEIDQEILKQMEQLETYHKSEESLGTDSELSSSSDDINEIHSPNVLDLKTLNHSIAALSKANL